MNCDLMSKGFLIFASSTLLFHFSFPKRHDNESPKIGQDTSVHSAVIASKPEDSSKSKDSSKYKGVFVELVLPVAELGRAEVLLNNDTILTKAVRDARESIYVYILEERSECVVNSVEMLHYMSDVYSQLWDEMVAQGKMSLSCAVVCDAVDSPFSAPAGLYSQPCVEALYTTNLSPIRTKAISSIRAAAGIDEPLVFEQCAAPRHLTEEHSAPPGIFYLDSGFVGGSSPALPVYGTIALGGTFDQLHNGHRKLLTLGAGLCTDVLVVGVMSDDLLRNKTLANLIQPYEQRVEAVVAFLALIKPALRVAVFKLTDPFGPTVTDSTIEALVVSSETVGGVLKINEVRVEKGFAPLVGLVVRREDISILSSTFIREALCRHK